MSGHQWPRKTRELHNHHFDSTVWNEFKFRDGDIVIGTAAPKPSSTRASMAAGATCWPRRIVSAMRDMARRELGEECAQWLKNGGVV